MMMALINIASVLLSDVSPQTPVMDLMWWAWLLLVGAAILVVSLAIAWQAHLVQPPQGEHGDEAAEHHEAQ